MERSLMNLKIVLPNGVLIDQENVQHILAETPDGYVGILPLRLNCVTALVPGILTFESEREGEVHMAIDKGVLRKAGMDVVISVENAISGTDMCQLYHYVKQGFQPSC